MEKRRLRGPSPALVISLLALFVALGGTAYAATRLPRNSVGTKQLKKNAVTAPKIAKHAVTAAKINTKGLTVPNAAHATNADELGGNATGFFLPATGTAANSSELGGALPAAFQSRVTGTCGGNSGIAQIGSAGGVTCANAQFYSGRLVEPIPSGFPTPTFLTIPGIAHVIVLNCQAANANAEIHNDSGGATDIWTAGDTSYVGTSWISVNTTFAPTSGETFHLGEGSGSGAKAITITVSTEATGSECVFQATAEVIGAS